MKKILIYIAGIMTGVLLTVLISVLITRSNNGITMFDEPGGYMEGRRFEVFQVIDSGAALARTEKIFNERTSFKTSSFTGRVVLLINDKGTYYYDEEIVEIPKGKRARQIGIYKYPTKMGNKTVPIIRIME